MITIFAKESTRSAFENWIPIRQELHEKLHPNILWFLLNHCQLVLLIGDAKLAEAEVRFVKDYIFEGMTDKDGNPVERDMIILDNSLFPKPSYVLNLKFNVAEPEWQPKLYPHIFYRFDGRML